MFKKLLRIERSLTVHVSAHFHLHMYSNSYLLCLSAWRRTLFHAKDELQLRKLIVWYFLKVNDALANRQRPLLFILYVFVVCLQLTQNMLWKKTDCYLVPYSLHYCMSNYMGSPRGQIVVPQKPLKPCCLREFHSINVTSSFFSHHSSPQSISLPISGMTLVSFY